jgi:hypothetical protein
VLAWLVCKWRGAHRTAKRHPLGSFVCGECGTVGADLAEMGLDDVGYVRPQRRIYNRADGSITRTSRYESDQRGNW